MAGNYIVVHRTYDPIQAELLGELLRDAGLAAQVIGTRSGAAIGVGQVIMELYIQVPAEQAGEAIDFLEAYFEQDGVGLLREAGLMEEAGDKPLRADVLRPLLAAGSVLLMFGGSHLYARRLFTALVIASGQVLAIANMASGTWEAYVMGATMFGLLLAFDLIGGQLAVRAYNRGDRPSRLAELLVGALLVAAAGSIGMFAGPRVAEPAAKRPVAVSSPALIASNA